MILFVFTFAGLVSGEMGGLVLVPPRESCLRVKAIELRLS